MYTNPCLAEPSLEIGAIHSDYPISDLVNDINHKLRLTHQCHIPLPIDTLVLSTPPINRLPVEVLLRIFDLAHYLWWFSSTKKETADEPAVWDRSIRKIMASGQPEALSHVCSLWREIILSSPVLWSQLELYTLGQTPLTYLSRCSAFLPRTQNHDLELFVRFRHCEGGPLADGAAMRAFCSSVAPRLSNLTIDNLAPNDPAFVTSIIQASLPHATPGTLTELFIKDYCARAIFNQADNDGLTGWELPTAEAFGISQHSLDSILHPIRSLRLRGQFFPWTSPAYHGLTKLHLLCTRPKHGIRPFIKVSQLREILLACPELRRFRINIDITDQNTCQALPPVPLDNLVELNIGGLPRNLYDVLLPLLVPGQKPLQLTIQTQSDASAALYCSATLSFFQRTNVTSLYVLNRSALDQRLSVDQLLTQSPANVLTLGLQRITISNLDSARLDHMGVLPIQLECLCLRKCTFDVGAFIGLAKIIQARVLKLHRPEFQDTSSEGEAQMREEIASTFSCVKWVRSTRDMDLWIGWELEYE